MIYLIVALQHKPLNCLAKGQSESADTCFKKASGEDKA